MKKTVYLLITSLLLLLAHSCAQAEPLSATEFALDTVVTVSLYEGGSQEALQDSLDLCRSYDDMFSITKPDSDIGRVNAAQGQPVSVSDDTAELLRVALQYCAQSEGALDITIGAVSSLWDFKAESPQLPDKAELSAALKTVDYRKVSLEGNTVTLADPGAKLDLGSVAKGFIADKMAACLRGQGVTSAVINLGGNIYVIGDKYGQPFKIGVRAPFADGQTEVGIVRGKDLSVVTSGIYERCFTRDGRLYHHILDTKTGYPVVGELSSVTIVSKTSAEGDALSTLFFALGRERAEEFLRATDAAAVLIDRNGQIYTVGEMEFEKTK